MRQYTIKTWFKEKQKKKIVKSLRQFSGYDSKLNDNHILEFNNISKTYTRFDVHCIVSM